MNKYTDNRYVKEYGYNYFRKEEVKETKESVKKVLEKWHKIHPDYIFATETAAIPPSYIIKEAWKKAYPNEKIPAFYRIDPVVFGSEIFSDRPPSVRWEEATKKYFKERIKKDNAKIIVYDEHYLLDPKLFFFKGKQIGHEVGRVTLRLTAEDMNKCYAVGYINKKPGKIYLAGWDTLLPFLYIDDVPKLNQTHEYRPTSKLLANHRQYMEDKSQDEKVFWNEYLERKKKGIKEKINLTGRIVRYPEQRERARGYITDLKKIGREAGEELAQSKNLENKVLSVIAIAGFWAGIFFLSPIVTGNAVGNLNQTSSNWIGGILFIVGLISAFVYFRRRK